MYQGGVSDTAGPQWGSAGGIAAGGIAHCIRYSEGHCLERFYNLFSFRFSVIVSVKYLIPSLIIRAKIVGCRGISLV